MRGLQAAGGTALNDTARLEPGDRPRHRSRLLLGIAVLLLILDQVTKHLAVSRLGDAVVPLVGDVLQLRLIRNPGAAFSLFTDLTVLLTGVSAVVAVVILWVSRRVTSTGWAVALGLLLGGVLGNLTDRLFRQPGPLRGHVVDFLELPNWPVFNLADSAVVCAAVLVVLLSLRGIPYEAPRVGTPPEDEPREAQNE
ncbi:MAG TPA: signal peptidase II [Jiangellaceae bacterium]|nr:signal peptidase II [Jiangellaceae bacterium]